MKAEFEPLTKLKKKAAADKSDETSVSVTLHCLEKQVVIVL